VQAGLELIVNALLQGHGRLLESPDSMPEIGAGGLSGMPLSLMRGNGRKLQPVNAAAQPLQFAGLHQYHIETAGRIDRVPRQVMPRRQNDAGLLGGGDAGRRAAEIARERARTSTNTSVSPSRMIRSISPPRQRKLRVTSRNPCSVR
jgi:hypothetical protein